MSSLKKLIMAANQQDDNIILPDIYLRCEYIECEQKQYTDLGYALTDKHDVSISVGDIISGGVSHYIFGNIKDSSKLYAISEYHSTLSMYIGTWRPTLSYSVKTKNTITLKKFGISINSNFYPNENTSEFITDGNAFLGAANGATSNLSYSFGGKIYRFKVYYNSNLQHDYIPAFNTENRYAGFYDLVTREFLVSVSGTPFKYKIYGIETPYLAFEALENDLQVSITKSATQYSLDRVTWFNLSAEEMTPPIAKGKKVWFKAILNASDETGIGTFSCTQPCNLEGSPMSLLYGDDCVGRSSLKGSYCFAMLFSGNENIIRINNPADFLPAIKISSHCYYMMFRDCKNLKNAVYLPSLNLTQYGYAYMYYKCTSLEETFDFPAWVSNSGIYSMSYMFNGCTSLKKQPNIPSVMYDVQNGLFSGMFSECTSLEETGEGNIRDAGARRYYNTYRGCINLKSAKNLKKLYIGRGFNLQNTFSGCTSLEECPEEIYGIVGSEDVASAFANCISLTKSPIIRVDNEKKGLSNTFNGCSKLKYIIALFPYPPSNNYWCAGVPSPPANKDDYDENQEYVIVLDKNIEWNPENYRGTSGIPNRWKVRYCDPDNIEDIRDTIEEFAPDQYTLLDYIQTDGGQYINSRIILDSNCKIEVNATLVSSTSSYVLFGNSYDGTNSENNRITCNVCNLDASTSRFNGAEFKGNLYREGRHTWAIDSNGLYIDDIKVGDWNTDPVEFTHASSFYIFGDRRSDGSVELRAKAGTRIHWVKVHKNNELVAEMVPALRNSKKPGLYDTINKRFLTNIGTGEFTYR